jgi:nanoRNase/pAp phosphatase (c-di-AMP/oligoRNAs hydrolase)
VSTGTADGAGTAEVADMRKKKKTAQRFAKLSELLKDKTTLLVVMQDFPDPDAIASAVALREIAKTLGNTQCSIAHGGVVGRAENAALVKYLGLNLRHVDELDEAKFDLVAMVDTQPGTGNNSLSPDVIPDVVIDHHPMRSATRKAAFTDIRSRYGATSTILYEYLRCAEITPDVPLATALLYGIRSDTQDLGREATRADVTALLDLYPISNVRMLSTIRNGRVPREYFRLLAEGLTNARVFGSAIITALGDIDSADMLGEIADLLLRTEETKWALCYGICHRKLWLSLRTSEPGTNAGAFMHRLVGRLGTGGGHNVAAGAQIPLANESWVERNRLESLIIQRFLHLTGGREQRGQRLIPRAR